MEATETEPLDVERIRRDFPILSREVADGVPLAHFVRSR